MVQREHWDSVYESKSDEQVSWTQPEPRLSLSLIRKATPSGRVIDVGGGTSLLAQRLAESGYSVAVLDISKAALQRARVNAGPLASRIEWIAADVTDPSLDLKTFDVWHDRAVFHFLTQPADRQAYVSLLTRSLSPGAHAIIATFTLDGPEQCSGLPVQRYDATTLASELGASFQLLQSVPETHHTPWGKPQSFQYSLFRRA